MTITRRQKRYMIGLGITLTLVIIIALLCLVVLKGGPSLLSPALTISLLALLSVIGVICCLPWWRALDEMQKDINLTSWYWGSAWGWMTGATAALVLGGPGSPMAQGALLVGLAQIVGASIVWITLRVTRRPQASA
jgi:hypothetical protein